MNFLNKCYYLAEDNVEKLKEVAKQNGMSASRMLDEIIGEYNNNVSEKNVNAELLESGIGYINQSLVALDTCVEGAIPPTDNVFDYLRDAQQELRHIKVSTTTKTKNC